LNENTKGIVAIIAAIITYFTPDHIDAIIVRPESLKYEAKL
jgi:hypothetical protein